MRNFVVFYSNGIASGRISISTNDKITFDKIVEWEKLIETNNGLNNVLVTNYKELEG